MGSGKACRLNNLHTQSNAVDKLRGLMLHLGAKRVYQEGNKSRPGDGGSMRDQVRKSITTLVFVATCGLGFGAAAQVAPGEIKPTAPDRYVVVQGDTLWSIAQRYLQAPQRWPDLWQMNRDSLKNPHRIFPGDVLVLDRARGQLGMATPSDSVKLSPRVRVEDATTTAIPS